LELEMNPVTLSALTDELEKISFRMPRMGAFSSGLSKVKNVLTRFSHAGPQVEVAGLAILAAPSIDNMVAKRRAFKAGVGRHGHVPEAKLNKFRMIKEKHHDAIETAGLGLLAAPYIAGRIGTGKWPH
jgi:hypothetical protein